MNILHTLVFHLHEGAIGAGVDQIKVVTLRLNISMMAGGMCAQSHQITVFIGPERQTCTEFAILGGKFYHMIVGLKR